MKRTIKLASFATACFAAGALLTGLAVATTTTHPITLCMAKLGGNVTAPGSNGQCGKLQTAIYVASASDVAALSARLDQDEQLLTALQAATPAKLDLQIRQNDGFVTIFSITGSMLKPGSDVVAHLGNGSSRVDGTPPVASDGTISTTDSLGCGVSPFYFTGTSFSGATITSNTLSC